MYLIKPGVFFGLLLASPLSGCLLQEASIPSAPKPAVKAQAIKAQPPVPITIDPAEQEQILAYSRGLFAGSGDPALADNSSPDTESPSWQSHDPLPLVEIPDIWTRLRDGYQLPDSMKKRVQSELAWYTSHPAYIQRVVKRAEPFLYFILSEIEQRNMPTEIALLPIVESAFQPFAYSHGRAAGIWQFIPATGRMYDLKQNWWYDGRRDIYASTKAAIRYLEKLHKFVGRDWLLALAAYNSGAGTVLKAVKKNKRRGRKQDFWSLSLPKETQSYVPRLLALSMIFATPEKYGISLPRIEDQPHFAVVDTKSQIDLALAADLAGLSMSELYSLNPAFNQWATDPKGPHRLLVPIEKADSFSLDLAQLEPKKRINWKRHKIRSGDSLLSLASKYRTTVPLIKRVNNLRGNMIRAGKHLIIPVASRSLNTYSKSTVQRTASVQNLKRKGVKQRYVVRPGDTLWDISQAYKVNVRALAKWNGMAPRDTLQSGQKLVIWSKSQASAPRQKPVPTGSIRTIRYTVRNGDSLARISQKFKVSVTDLRRWNRLPKNKYLQPGQKLRMQVDVTRQSGII